MSAIQAENKQTRLKQTSKPAKVLKEAHSESFADAPRPGLRSHQVNPERAVDVAPTLGAGWPAGHPPQAAGLGASPERPTRPSTHPVLPRCA